MLGPEEPTRVRRGPPGLAPYIVPRRVVQTIFPETRFEVHDGQEHVILPPIPGCWTQSSNSDRRYVFAIVNRWDPRARQAWPAYTDVIVDVAGKPADLRVRLEVEAIIQSESPPHRAQGGR